MNQDVRKVTVTKIQTNYGLPSQDVNCNFLCVRCYLIVFYKHNNSLWLTLISLSLVWCSDKLRAENQNKRLWEKLKLNQDDVCIAHTTFAYKKGKTNFHTCL